MEVAAVRGQEAVGQADFVDSKPGRSASAATLQVDLKVAVRAGHPLAAVHVDRRPPFL